MTETLRSLFGCVLLSPIHENTESVSIWDNGASLAVPGTPSSYLITNNYPRD